jgi:hypothetical protein
MVKFRGALCWWGPYAKLSIARYRPGIRQSKPLYSANGPFGTDHAAHGIMPNRYDTPVLTAAFWAASRMSEKKYFSMPLDRLE